MTNSTDAGGVKSPQDGDGLSQEEKDFIHALSTPLTVALMQAEHILSADIPSPKIQERVERIVTALRKMDGLMQERRSHWQK